MLQRRGGKVNRRKGINDSEEKGQIQINVNVSLFDKNAGYDTNISSVIIHLIDLSVMPVTL